MKVIAHVLESIHDRNTIETFIKQQDHIGCITLLNVLRYTKQETADNWMIVYNDLFK